MHVGVFDVDVLGDDRVEHALAVSLAHQLQRGARVDGRLAHGEQEAQDAQAGVEELLHFFDGLGQLDDAVQFEVARRDHHQRLLGGGQGVDRQPGQRRRTVDEQVVVARLDRFQLLAQPGFTVVAGRGQLQIGVGQQDVRGDDVELGDSGLVDAQRLALQDGAVQGLVGLQAGVIRQQHFGGVGLAVGVDQQHALALLGQAGAERDGGGGFAGAAFLRGDGCNHRLVNLRQSRIRVFAPIAPVLTIALAESRCQERAAGPGRDLSFIETP